MDLFEFTDRPAESLLFTRADVYDTRLGEVVMTEPGDYARASTVILGCPQDEGVRRNRGREGAREGPTEVRRALYKLTSFGVRDEELFDLGDLKIARTLEETHERQHQLVTQLLRDRKKLIVIGGGNDISYPNCSALIDLYPDAVALNIDAHFDVRDDKEANSGTPYRQLLENGGLNPARFFEIGYQRAVNSEIYLAYLEDLGVNCISLAELRHDGVMKVISDVVGHTDAPAAFWGFDVDVVRSSDAPGASAPSPTGLTGEEFCELARLAGDRANTRIIEFTEVNPAFDIDSRTAKLVAFAIHEFLSASVPSR